MYRELFWTNIGGRFVITQETGEFMESQEKWVEIMEFPIYAISTHGRVMNINTDMIKTPTPNSTRHPPAQSSFEMDCSVAVL